MTERDALTRAVLVNPADDLPRLVFADWLDENGEPDRAEFIRVQFELAKPNRLLNCDCGERWGGPVPLNSFPVPLTICPTSRCYGYGPPYPDVVKARRRHGELLKLERELLCYHGDEWFAPDRQWGVQLAGEPSLSIPQVTVRRGFVAEVRCTQADWYGGECGRCGGEGDVSASDATRDRTGAYTVSCPVCTGRGQLVGVGPTLVAAHPVERVVLNDREPYWNGAAYCWFNADRPSASGAVPGSAILPAELFDLIDGHNYSVAGRMKGWTRPKDGDPQAALSLALLNVERRKLGLPLLTVPTSPAPVTEAVPT